VAGSGGGPGAVVALLLAEDSLAGTVARVKLQGNPLMFTSLKAVASRPNARRWLSAAAGLAFAATGAVHAAKAEDTTTIDLKGKSSIGDYMVVTSRGSQRHVGALAEHVLEDLHDAGVRGLRVEGMRHCDWVLIDAGDVIVHVFRPEVRTFYSLEKMWSAGRPDGRRAS